MPYHVIVSRQVLLDGPQAFFTTVTLCLLIRFARSGRTLWLCCAAAGMGLSVLAKEPSVIFCGAVYAFFALTPEIRVRLRAIAAVARRARDHDRAVPAGARCSRDRPAPAATSSPGSSSASRTTASVFYLTAVPSSIGLAVCALAALSLLAAPAASLELARDARRCWIGVPVAFLELWPVKGFQYLLPVAPVIAVLAADGVVIASRAIARTRADSRRSRARGARRGAARHARRADLRGGRTVVAR